MLNPQELETRKNRASIREAVLHGVTLAVWCVISYWLVTQLLARALSVSRDDDLLGGMWAVVATVFVYGCGYDQSVGAALSRIAATSLNFVLCFVYLLLFPFQLWGMAALIGVGAVVMSLLGRPDDIITTGITTTVVMVVAAISPEHAWKQPVLRMVDTIVGIAVGVAGHLRRLFRRGDEHHDALVPQRSGDDGHPSDGRTDESVFTVCERRRGDLVHIDEDGGLALCASDGGRGSPSAGS